MTSFVMESFTNIDGRGFWGLYGSETVIDNQVA